MLAALTRGMFGLPHFLIKFLFMKYKGANFACAYQCAYLISWCKIFFSKKCQKNHFLENGWDGFFCFLRIGEAASILKTCNIILSPQSVAHPFGTKGFGTHTKDQGGFEMDSPGTSRTMNATDLKPWEVLEVFFDVSKNFKLI